MNPDVNKIFNKFKEDKINLANHKLDLNLVDDLNKVRKDSVLLEQEIKEINDIIGVNRKYARDAFKDQEKSKKAFDKASAETQKLNRQFIEAKGELEKAERKHKGDIERRERFIKNAERFVNKRKPLLKQAFKNISFFDKMIGKAEKAAKELGMKIPTASFSQMRAKLDKLTRIL